MDHRHLSLLGDQVAVDLKSSNCSARVSATRLALDVHADDAFRVVLLFAATSGDTLALMSHSTVRIFGLSSDRARMALYSYLLAPWPEWHDNDLPEERWDSASSRMVQQASPKEKVSKQAAGAAAKTPVTSAPTSFSAEGFENPLGHCPMPPSLTVARWKRPTQLNVGLEIFRKDVDADAPDLVTPNLHILHSEVMREVVATVINLYHYAQILPFKNEMESGDFVSNGSLVWKPWHHVYSLCTAGKGEHKPQVNPYGKYIVRLFFMGCWRRITVDDYLPYDEHDRLLLPTTPQVFGKKLELWPLLLTKALLTVASLTWRPGAEVVDYHAMTCLTGWFCQSVECKRVPPKYLWSICQKLLMARAEDAAARYTAEPVAPQIERLAACEASVITESTNDAEEDVGVAVVCGEMGDVTDTVEALDDVGPCVGHRVLMSEARVIRIGDTGELPKWKLFRWKSWALRNGIIQDENVLNLRSVRLYSPLRKLLLPPPGNLVNVPVEVEPEPVEEDDGKKKSPNKGVNKPKPENKPEGSKAGGKIKKPPTPIKENRDAWMDLNVLSKYLNRIHMFLRPSSFAHSLKALDVSRCGTVSAYGEKLTVKKSPMRHSRDSLGTQNKTGWPSFRTHRPKDHFYLLIDTLTCKKLFITMTVVPQQVSDMQEQRLINPAQVSSETYAKGIPYTMICQQYDWKSTGYNGKSMLTLKTTGTKTHMLQLGEGLHIFRFWTNTAPNHTIEIRSQTPFTVGSSEDIFKILAHPSFSLNHYGAGLFNKFTVLRDTPVGTSAHEKALADFHSVLLPKNLSEFFSNAKLHNKWITDLRDKFEEAITVILHDKLRDNMSLLETALKELQTCFANPGFGLQTLQNISPQWCEHMKQYDEPPPGIGQGDTPAASRTSQPVAAKPAKKGGDKKGGDKKAAAAAAATTTPSSGGTKTPTKGAAKPKKSAGELRNLKSADKKPKNHVLFESETASGIAIMLKLIELEPSNLRFYPFRNDLAMHLVHAEHKGIANVVPNQDWFPVVRFTVNVDHPGPAYNIVRLETSAPSFWLCIIDNDTLEEIPNVIADKSKYHYVRNELGYTILGVGFSDPKSKTYQHTWNLRIVSDARENLLHAVSPAEDDPPKIVVSQVFGHYIPNRRDNVLRCLLSIQQSQIVSLRFVMSNRYAEFKVTIVRDNDVVPLYEVSCKGQRVVSSLPLLIDDYAERPVVFLVEAELIKGGWGLTSQEETLVHIIKEKLQQDLMVFSNVALDKSTTKGVARSSSSGSGGGGGGGGGGIGILKRRLTSTSRESTGSMRDLLPGAAHWMVQVVVDADKLSGTVLEQNTRKEQEIRHLKAAWEEADPGRFRRAMSERRGYVDNRQGAQHKEVVKYPFGSSHVSLNSPSLSDTYTQKGGLHSWMEWTQRYRKEQALKRREAVAAFDKTCSEFLDAARTACEKRRRVERKLSQHYVTVRQAAAETAAAAYHQRDEYARKLLEMAETERKAELKERELQRELQRLMMEEAAKTVKAKDAKKKK